MNKIDFLKDFASKTTSWERRTLLTALVSCLTSDITAQMLDPLLFNDPILRSAILSKVKRDIETGGCQPYHIALAENLISLFPSLPASKKQTCGYFLSFLYSSLPSDAQRQIVKFFIMSRYVTVRNRGYKILSRNWNIEYETAIRKSWKKYHDFYCATLIVNNFPDTFLVEHFSDLEELLTGEAGYARLCIRACNLNPSLLQHNEKRDGITFAYVTLKLGKTLTRQQSFAIFNEFKFDDRIRLFIWCLGRMKLWSVLENIARNSEQLIEEKTAWYRNKYRIK
jgi:hypothetical protein